MIISGLFTLATTWLSGRVEKQKKAQEMQLAEMENKARLLRDENTNNHEWEMANLVDKDKWLRRVSFIMFTWPFVWIYFDPEGATRYFQILDTVMPDWYKQTYMGITGGIWGLASLKNTLPALTSGIKKALS